MSSATTVRAATSDDIDAIIAVHRRSWAEGYRGIVSTDLLPSDDEWRQRLENTLGGDDLSMIVAEADDGVHGFATFGSSRDADAGERTGEVIAIYVDPSSWRSGIGAALIDRATSELRMRGFEEVTLWSFERNMRSRSFYEALRFRADGATQRRLRFENAGELRYRRSLA